MVKMIRDGLLLDNKGYPKSGKAENNFSTYLNDDIKPMSFNSWCTLMDHINITGDYKYLYQIKDPYALMLILGVYEKVSIPPNSPKKEAYDGKISCEEVWDVLKENDLGNLVKLVERINEFELEYLKKIASGKNIEEITVKKAFQILAEYRNFHFSDAYTTWVLQPDQEAISFAIISKYTNRMIKTPKYRITPALGIPINMMYPRGVKYDTRFPCLVSRNWFDVARHVQVHKSLDKIRVFDSSGNSVELTDEQYEELNMLLIDGLFDGFMKSDGEFVLYDIVCINDIWLHNRPLYERCKFFWHFGTLGATSLYAWNWKDIRELKGSVFFDDVIIRNLNRPYCPIMRDAWVSLSSNVVQAVIKREPGRRNTCTLRSSDNVVLFTFKGNRISRDDMGKVVDVDLDGTVLRYRFDLKEAQSWENIKEAWNVKEPPGKKIRWRSLKKLV